MPQFFYTKHPICAVLAVVSGLSLPTLVVLSYQWRSIEFFISIIESLCLISIAIIPKIGSCSTIIVVSASMLFSFNSVIHFYFSLPAIFIWTYINKGRQKYLFCIIESLAVLIGWYVGNRSDMTSFLTGFIIIECFLAIPVAAGSALRWKDKAIIAEKLQHELRIKQAEISQRLERIHLGQVIHNSITGDLTYLILRSQRQRDDPSSMKEYIDTVEQYATYLLNEIHDVITILEEGDATSNPKNNIQSFPVKLLKVVEENDKKMNNVGIHGKTYIKGRIPQSTNHDNSIIILITELYTNIMRHCSKGNESYAIIITLSADQIAIVEVNDNKQASVGGKSGRGLQHCRELIAQMNGKLSISNDTEGWMIQITIPLAEDIQE